MQTSLFRRSALLVENHPRQELLYRDVLAANGFDVFSTKSPMESLLQLKASKTDIFIINTEVAGETFLEKFLLKVRSDQANDTMPIIGLSLYSCDQKTRIKNYLDSILTKPVSTDTFIEKIFKCLENRCGKVE